MADNTPDITITVTGPGGVISLEVEVIKQALEAIGVVVDVADPYRPDQATMEKWLQATTRNMKAKLIAVHCPWGG